MPISPVEEKEVRFDIYCQKCINKNTCEIQNPCNECLDHTVNFGTEKPWLFKEAK